MRRNFNSFAMIGMLLLSDFVGLLVVWSLSVWIRYAFGGQFALLLYWHLAPCLVLFLMANALVGLYPGILLRSSSGASNALTMRCCSLSGMNWNAAHPIASRMAAEAKAFFHDRIMPKTIIALAMPR